MTKIRRNFDKIQLFRSRILFLGQALFMQYRYLGTTGIKISEIGLGCASYWGKKIFNQNTAINIVHQALDQGVSFFDTGHSYSGGNAESRLGKAICHIGDKSHLCLSSKAGTRIANNGKLFKDFSADWIKKSCHQSLKNLRADALGVFHLHGPNPEDFTDKLLTTLSQLKQNGEVRSLAVNAFDDHIIKTAVDTGVFDCIMLDYNIMRQDRNILIKQLYDKKIAVLAAAPLAGSLYSNKLFKLTGPKDLWYLARALKNSPKKIIQARKFKFINKFKHTSGSQIALGFVLQNPKISCAVFGTTNPKHLSENLQASGIKLPAELLHKISALG
ncbi:hypothetical protein MNBD_GAMMA01-2152 [hydrothermal vent metagenome]|uniref:NADP-dependent oxidoreductase domain-containing protein n=1 Tax=hydrothermal vent metagenome TaxID=652676 RepID=A0A3B0VZU5_9ZZZZ